MAIFVLSINVYINLYSRDFIKEKISSIPGAHTGLILGAMVYSSGALSSILKDRMLKGIELYNNKKVKKLLLSGDHGTRYYDEVNNMKKFLLKKKIPGSDIFTDHAGFSTYESLVRAQKVFLARKVVIVTQKYHLARAVYIARKIGLDAYGYTADRRKYINIMQYQVREIFANIKAFFEVLTMQNPTFLGPVIPITGNGKTSWDRKK